MINFLRRRLPSIVISEMRREIRRRYGRATAAAVSQTHSGPNVNVTNEIRRRYGRATAAAAVSQTHSGEKSNKCNQ